MLAKDLCNSVRAGVIFFVSLCVFFSFLLISVPAYSASSIPGLSAPGRNIPTSVIHMVLTISVALIIISLLVTYFSLKLRKLNEVLLEKNRNITDENKDLQKMKDELAYQKELIAKELYESEEFFRMLLQSVNDGIAYYERDKNQK